MIPCRNVFRGWAFDPSVHRSVSPTGWAWLPHNRMNEWMNEWMEGVGWGRSNLGSYYYYKRFDITIPYVVCFSLVHSYGYIFRKEGKEKKWVAEWSGVSGRMIEGGHTFFVGRMVVCLRRPTCMDMYRRTYRTLMVWRAGKAGGWKGVSEWESACRTRRKNGEAWMSRAEVVLYSVWSPEKVYVTSYWRVTLNRRKKDPFM